MRTHLIGEEDDFEAVGVKLLQFARNLGVEDPIFIDGMEFSGGKGAMR